MKYENLKVMTIDEAMSNYDDKTEFCLEDEVYEMYRTYDYRIKSLNSIIRLRTEYIKKLEEKLRKYEEGDV